MLRVFCDGPCPPGLAERMVGLVEVGILAAVALVVVLVIGIEVYRVRQAEPLVENVEAEQ